MSIFKSYKYSWQQIGIFKLSLLTIGAILGAYFADFVLDYLLLFVAVAVVSTAYVMIVSLKQSK